METSIVGILSRGKRKLDEFSKKIGLHNLDTVPDKCGKLFIDVGTAIDAPNSANWLLNYEDAYVIGIEPSPINIAILQEGRPANVSFPYLRLVDNSIIRNGVKVGDIGGRFCLLQCAIDDVNEPTTASFYLTDKRNTGCSSLLKPTAKLGLNVDEIYQTPVISLKTALEHVPFEKFEYITYLKTDAQGKDLDVVKSCKEYLEKVLILQMEVNTGGQYEDEQDLEELEEYVVSQGFMTIGGNFHDRVYRNKKLAAKVGTPKIQFIDT
jgi:hypothetical protein